MKTPICSFDAKSGVLCSNCESKLKSGDISQDDFDASVKLTKLSDHISNFNNFTLVRGTKVGDDFVLVMRSSDIGSLRRNIDHVREIEKAFQRKIWFVESEASDRTLLENLLHPAKVLNVNLFWLPDGNRLTKVTVSGREKPKINIDRVQQIAKVLRNIDLIVDYDQNK